MKYILSETEYAALQSRIANLKSANSSLIADLLKADHKLGVSAKVREADRAQIASQSQEIDNFKKEIVKANSMLHSAKRDMDGMEKKVSDLSAQLAALAEENQTYYDQIVYFRNLAGDRYDRLQKVEAERNALQESLAKAQRRIEHSEYLSERRLRLANELQTKVQRLKHEPVAIVLNPSTKRYRAVSLGKVGTYERFGWEVLDGEGAPVDRPA